MQPDRYVNIGSGTLMVISDLHGDGEIFDRYIETFMALHEQGEADRLIFIGDLVHGYGTEEEDASVRMVLRVMDLQDRLGKDTVIMLLGNHEMPHIYGVSLAKGNLEFTPRFEHQMGEYRRKIVEFFMTLPFVIRTNAGVLLCHAGPDESSINRSGRLRRFDHQELLRDAERNLKNHPNLDEVYEAYAQLSGQSYESLAKKYLAVSGPDDPRYSDLMRALFIQEREHRFGVLWDFLFTQNDRGLLPAVYEQITIKYLDAMSVGAPVQQRVCVSGHISVPQGGYFIVNDRHFRLASGIHASPRTEARYLLLDSTKAIHTSGELIQYTRKIF